LNPNSVAAQAFTRGISRAKIALAANPGLAKTNTTLPQGAKNVAQAEDELNTPSLVVDVSIDSSKVSVSGTETVFIYARAWKGAKIPLAIKRIQVKDLPTQIRLSTDDAMAQGMDITTSPQLEVLARLSKSGQAVPQSGDWQISFGPVSLDEQKSPIKLQISEQLP